MKKGYQLFSAWKKCADAAGLKDVVRRIAAMGYDGVEFFSYAGVPAAEMKALLDECGICAFNSHVQLERWQKDADFEIAYARALGMEALTIPYIAPEDRNGATYEKLCASIPVWAQKCRENGLRLCYHNHDFEFERQEDGRYLLDRILAADDELLLEPDTFWAFFAGVDPAALLEQHRRRVRFIHIKDYLDLEQKPFPAFTAIGTGRMDNAPVLSKAKEIGAEWIVVEQDNSPIDELESARLSLQAMRAWF